MALNFIQSVKCVGGVENSYFQSYTEQYTSQNKIFEYGYLHSNVHLKIYSLEQIAFLLKLYQKNQPITTRIEFSEAPTIATTQCYQSIKI